MTLSDPIKRFWKRVKKSDGCWLWVGNIHKEGYGFIKVKVDGIWKNVKAHRYSYQVANGPFDQSLHVLHRCDNPPCVNPSHLFLGTNADNVKDSTEKGRRVVQNGARNHNCKLSPKQVLEIKNLKGKENTYVTAERYNVSKSQIWRIQAGKQWNEARA